jgi:hypothetical protein
MSNGDTLFNTHVLAAAGFMEYCATLPLHHVRKCSHLYMAYPTNHSVVPCIGLLTPCLLPQRWAPPEQQAMAFHATLYLP